MNYKISYDNKNYTGVTLVDRKVIHMAFQNGEQLSIDTQGRIYDSEGRYIADGKLRDDADIRKIIYKKGAD